MLSCFLFSWFSYLRFFPFFYGKYTLLPDKPRNQWGVWPPDPGWSWYFPFSHERHSRTNADFMIELLPAYLYANCEPFLKSMMLVRFFWSQRYHLFEDIRPDMIVNSLPASCSGFTRGVPFSLLFCFANFLWHSPWYSVATFPQALSRRWRDFLFESKAFSLTRSLILDPWSLR